MLGSAVSDGKKLLGPSVFLVEEISEFGSHKDPGILLQSLGERSHGWLGLCLPWGLLVLWALFQGFWDIPYFAPSWDGLGLRLPWVLLVLEALFQVF